METTEKLEELTLETLTDVTGGAGWRNWVCGAGVALGIATNGIAIGPMGGGPGPASASGYSIMQK
jgi:hypothetical protein